MEIAKLKNGTYEMFIRQIVDKIAYCKIVDDNGKKLDMEGPIEDLEKICQEKLKPGLIFNVIVDNDGEDINFEHVERPHVSKKELDETRKYYKDKYGEV